MLSTGNLSVSAPSTPLGRLGRATLSVFAYLGGLVLLALAAISAVGRVGALSRSFRTTVFEELAWMVEMSLPLAAIISVGMGSFLAMQSYFGGTFVDGTGAVVGVGLIRYIGPLIAGLTLSGLFAAKMTPELRALHRNQARTREGFLERTEAGPVQGPAPSMPIDRLVAARMLAGGACGFVLSFWGSIVGTFVGWQIAASLIGVSTHSFFIMLFEMLWLRDVVGLLVKGSAFGAIAAWLACHEGLWRAGSDESEPIETVACRAASLSAIAVLAISGIWFTLFFVSGAPFGPTVLEPPTS